MTGEQHIKLNNGQIVWLDDPVRVWQVCEGAVDIYAVTAADSRRYRQLFLDQAGAGRLLFGLSPEQDSGIRLMAAAVKEAKLCAMSRTDFLLRSRDTGGFEPEKILSGLEAWLEALLAGLETPAAPRAFSLLAPGESLSLPAGRAVRAGRGLTWARLVSGEACFGLLPEGSLAPDMAIPLVKQTWLAAKNDTVLQGLTTADVFPPAGMADPTEFWQPLDRFHQLFANLTVGWFAGEDRRDSGRLAARKQLRERLMNGAANHLLRTEIPELAPVVTVDGPYSPLLLVVRAAAGYLGVAERQVLLPEGADPLRQDPAMLRSMVRLAGMQVRQVCLEPGWQQRDNGPLIGFRGPDRRPVALLPVSPHQYRLFDPGRAETVMLGDKTDIDIEPLAYALYAGLPGKALNLSDLLRFMLKKCWPSDLWSIVLISLIAGLIPVLTPLVTQTIFEHIIPINDRQGLVMVVQVMMVAAFATVGVAFAQGVAFLRVKNRSRLVAEAALWLRLLSLPAAFFRRYEAGDLAQRMNSITQLFSLLSNSVVSTLFNMLFSFWSLLVMLYYSWQLTLAAGMMWLVYLGVTGFLQWRMVVASAG